MPTPASRTWRRDIDRYIKDPDATLDYGFDWNRKQAGAADGTGYLAAGETITSSTWIVPTGITQVSASNTTTTTTIWLSGGTVGQPYLITNRIVTSALRVDDRTFRVAIADR